jgi:hypothetical protein
MEIDRTLKITWFSAFQKGFCTIVIRRYGMFFDLLPAFSIFSCKNSTFCDQDPDPPGSELVWLPGSGSVSGSALK